MITIEHTDTYGGETNYSWVHRYYHHPCKDFTDRMAVTLAKAACGYTGHRCKVIKMGEDIWIYPRGICQVIIVSYEEDNKRAEEYWSKQVDSHGCPVLSSEEKAENRKQWKEWKRNTEE